MTIRLDSTQISVVVLCSECPWWYGFAFTRDQGWQVGNGHLTTAHPGDEQARNALRKRATRRPRVIDFRVSGSG